MIFLRFCAGVIGVFLELVAIVFDGVGRAAKRGADKLLDWMADQVEGN